VIGAITAGLFSAPTAPVTNSYESIATVTVGAGGSTSISFSSIPSTFKHLQIRATARLNTNDFIYIQFNGDGTNTNYRSHWVEGSGSAASASSTQSPAGATFTYTQSNSSSIFDVSVADVLDYASSTKNKTVRSLRGCDNNGSGYVGLHSSFWNNTSAVTSMVITSPYTFQQYSQFALYGIKG
jgi:hypothetical protein